MDAHALAEVHLEHGDESLLDVDGPIHIQTLKCNIQDNTVAVTVNWDEKGHKIYTISRFIQTILTDICLI